jgi:Protein of unknown function (DUF1176)
MSLPRPLLLLLAAVLPASGASAQTALGSQEYFGDWAVGCDNTLSCEAVALDPENRPDEDALSLVIARSSGDGLVTITLIGEAAKTDRYRVLVDRRLLDSGAMTTAGDGTVAVTGAKGLRLARAIARGKELRLEDGQGKLLGRASLRGSTLALRHIDAMQKLAGSRVALASIGRKRVIREAVAAPMINARRIGPEGPVPDATDIIKLVENSGCTDQRFGPSEDSAHSLGQSGETASVLVLVNCGAGAYNVTSVAYVGKRAGQGPWSFVKARFDRDPVAADQKGGPYLVNAAWSPEKQQLSHYAKARGIGDCGTSATYVWDGDMFRLVEAFGMEQCRGSLNWMRLWRADVKMID